MRTVGSFSASGGDMEEESVFLLPAEGSMPNGIKRLIVIDDQEDIRSFLTGYFERRGVLVSEASTGRGGIKAVSQELPDLVLLDSMLDDISGIEVCKQLRSSKATGSIPIVFLTALDQDEFIAEAQQNGANAYIYKGSGLGGIMKKLNQLIELFEKYGR